jgi:hypothetical protein
MQHLRKFGMLLVNNRAFGIAGMSMIEARPDGWIFRTVTGITFTLNPVEADMLKQEILNTRGNIIQVSNAKYQSPFDCFRTFNWIVLPFRAFNAQSINAVELLNGSTPEAHYKITFMNNLQVELSPAESKFFDSECMTIIYETQRIMGQIQKS